MGYVNSAQGEARRDLTSLLGVPRKGKRYWVNTNTGSDSSDGSKGAPLLTMGEAFTRIASGDEIVVVGSIREQVSTPAQVFDVSIIGVGNRPRHADSTPAGGNLATADWRAPASPTSATPLLKIRQQGWRVQNILFVGPTDAASIQLFRDGGSGNDERDASHAEILGCRFAAGRYGVEDHGGCANVRIEGNTFQQFSDSGDVGLKSTTGAGIGTLWGWEVRGNRFLANASDIVAALANAQIVDNHFHMVALSVTNGVAINETGGAENLVAQNYMYCASDEAAVVNARFVKVASSHWGPNYYSDIAEYGEPAE